MYTIVQIFDNKFHLYYNDIYKGTLVMLKAEAELIVRCLNSHPLID